MKRTAELNISGVDITAINEDGVITLMVDASIVECDNHKFIKIKLTDSELLKLRSALGSVNY